MQSWFMLVLSRVGLDLERLVQALGQPNGDHAGGSSSSGLAAGRCDRGAWSASAEVRCTPWSSRNSTSDSRVGVQLMDDPVHPEDLAKEDRPVGSGLKSSVRPFSEWSALAPHSTPSTRMHGSLHLFGPTLTPVADLRELCEQSRQAPISLHCYHLRRFGAVSPFLEAGLPGIGQRADAQYLCNGRFFPSAKVSIADDRTEA